MGNTASDEPIGWLDNRDIRDRNYDGDLIVPSNSIHATSKKSALSVMKNVLTNDILAEDWYLVEK